MPLHILGKQYLFDLNSGLRIAEELIEANLSAVINAGETPMENKYVQELREQKPELFPEKSV